MADDAFVAIVESPAGPNLIRTESCGVNKLTITQVGPTGTFGCAAIAQSLSRTYSVCAEGIANPDHSNSTQSVH